jgi:hypothetical protein
MFVYIVADVSSGLPCDKDGYDIPNGPHPPRIDKSGPIDFTPFETGAEFEFAEFLYSKAEMSAGKIDKLLEILAALYPERTPSIADHKDLYQRIDSIQQGDIAWDSFSVKYNCNLLTPGAPKLLWMEQTFEVWFCDPLRVLKNQIGNPNFEDEIDYAPKQIYYKGKHRYENLMSRNWAWEQAVCAKSKPVKFYLTSLSRTKLPKMRQHMVQCLHQLFSEVTRLPCLLLPARMITTPYTYPLEMFTTLCGVLIEMLSLCWHSLLSRRVSLHSTQASVIPD